MKAGYTTMLKVLGGELAAAIALAEQWPTRSTLLRVKSIRREIKRVPRGQL
jgi:hypothetical protein